jgi:hypothetical protein
MSATREMYMAEIEQVGDDFAAGKIEEQEFRDRMRRLGFDPDEIDDHLEALMA